MVVLIALLANSGLSHNLTEVEYITDNFDQLRGRTTLRPKQRQVRLTESEVDELVKARQAGITINALAAQFGIHRTTVMEHLKRKSLRIKN